jgi:hypothetical protein
MERLESDGVTSFERDAGCRIQDAGCRMQDAGCRMQDEDPMGGFFEA